MAEEPRKAIFVGVGGRGRHYLEHLKGSPHVRPVALVDISQEVLERERLATGLPAAACFTTLTDALRQTPADTVAITTHARLHAQFAEEAICAGKHVLVEKPFTCNLAEAKRLVELAEANGVKIVVTQQIRYFRTERTMRRLMLEQAYGPPGFGHMYHYKPRVGPYPLSEHMQLWQMTVHEIDTLLSVLANHKVTRVFGYSFEPSWGAWPTPSSAAATIEFDGSIPFTLWFQRPRPGPPHTNSASSAPRRPWYSAAPSKTSQLPYTQRPRVAARSLCRSTRGLRMSREKVSAASPISCTTTLSMAWSRRSVADANWIHYE